MGQETYIAVSGGFDPIHEGHIEYLSDAAAFGKVIVLLNTDEWLVRKKGYLVQKWQARRRILENLRTVHCVLPAIDGDDTVCKSIENLRETIKYFGKGGDRFECNTPEKDVCERLEINIIYGLGGPKIQSSSKLVSSEWRSDMGQSC